MAEGGHSPELDLHFLECPICLERLRQPKSLPCLHCFCQECLGTYITKELSGKTASATSFPCPVCRRMTSPLNQTKNKDEWAEQFPTDAVIQDLINIKGRSSEPLYSNPCQTKGNLTTLAKFWCKMTNLNFCETCKLQLHDNLHTDCSVLDIVTGYHIEQPNREKSVPQCDQHHKKMVWYCEDHKILGCSICIFKNHRRCDEVTTATEYFQMLKAGSLLKDMQAALNKGAEAMDVLVKDFDRQLKIMAENQEIALKSIADLREKIDKQLDKLQKDVTEKLAASFKDEKRNLEASLLQSERLMSGMLNTMKSSVTAAEEDDTIETIVLYQRGQAEVESCKTLVAEMRNSFTSVSINHEVILNLGTLTEDTMGKIVVGKQPRCFPDSHGNLVSTMRERHVKKLGKISVKEPTDARKCGIFGVVYLPYVQIVISDYNNNKLKLFTDKGLHLDELTIRGSPRDMCLVSNNTVAVVVYNPGGICVVKVEDSKLSLSSEINKPNCLGITHRDGRYIVGKSGGEVYSVTQDGATELLHKYNNTCYYLTQDPVKGDTLVSVNNATTGEVAVSRLTNDKRHSDLMKVGVVSGATGIDVDKEGNIYVCGYSSHNVVKMSGDGAHVRELLTSSDGIHHPWAISVQGDTFVVTCYSNTDEDEYIHVFQLF